MIPENTHECFSEKSKCIKRVLRECPVGATSLHCLIDAKVCEKSRQEGVKGAIKNKHCCQSWANLTWLLSESLASQSDLYLPQITIVVKRYSQVLSSPKPIKRHSLTHTHTHIHQSSSFNVCAANVAVTATYWMKYGRCGESEQRKPFSVLHISTESFTV